MGRGRREDEYKRDEVRDNRDRVLRGHGDLGYIGEVKRDTSYKDSGEGGAVDRMLTSDECVPSFVETVRYAMKPRREDNITRGDTPRGKGPDQSGPYFGDVRSKDGTQPRAAYARGGHVKAKECMEQKHEHHMKKKADGHMDGRREHEMERKGHHRHHRLAAGGIGKVRKDQY